MMRRILFALILVVVVMTSGSPLAKADVNDFVINKFDSEATLTNKDPQGELSIVENIELTFTDNNHGILRALPESYNGHPLNLSMIEVTSSSGAPSEYTTYNSNGNKVLKIGDPDQTVTGKQKYTIKYQVNNVISFTDGKNQLIWNVNGTGWSQPFEQVSMVIHDKTSSKVMGEPQCFTGPSGSTSSDCFVGSLEDGFKIETTKALGPNENLTYQIEFAPSSFTAFSTKDIVAEILPKLLAFTLPILILGGASIKLWHSRGRDAKGRGVIIPEYEAPSGMKPMIAGTLMDFRTETKDITATIIDLAIRGYIKIIETKEVKTLRKDTTAYKLELINDDFSALDSREGALLTALFSTHTKGEVVDISKLSTKLHATATALSKDAKTMLQTEGYYRPKLGMGVIAKLGALWLIGFVAFAVAVATANGWLIAGLVIGAIISVICLALLSARTIKGVEAKEKVLGLKMYLEVAEKDRIAKLQSPNAPYASNANEPVKTVELFEKLLPFAMVLGVEQQWAKQFENLYTSPPDWYGGSSLSTFNSAALVSSIDSGVGSAVNQAFAAPSSSSSGGSSGGGGGGGGGGGW